MNDLAALEFQLFANEMEKNAKYFLFLAAVI